MRLLFTILLVAVVISTQAQNFKSGILLGIAATQVDGDESGGFNKAGLISGLYSKLPIGDKWSAQAEIKFMQKGSKDVKTVAKDGYDSYFAIYLNYAEMSFRAQYKITKKLYGELGPSFGYLISSSVDPDGYGRTKVSSFNKIDFSSNAGIGYKISEKLYGNIIYAYSLMSIVQISDDITYMKRKQGAYNNVTAITLYYQFGSTE